MAVCRVASPSDLINLVGQTLGPTDGITIDQTRIDQFAAATGDHQWIHIDPERAASGPFGATIAHGYLTLSLASQFIMQLIQVEHMSAAVNYGTERVRFPSPVRVGSTLCASGEVLAVEEFKGGYKMILRVTIQASDADKPACIVDSISVFYP